MTRSRLSPVLVIAGLFTASISILAWVLRFQLHSIASDYPAVYPALILGTALLCLTFAIVLSLESIGIKRAWLTRIADIAEMEDLRPPGIYKALLNRFPDIFELIFAPLLLTSIGHRLSREWVRSELGAKGSRYLLVLLIFAAGGFFIGVRVGGILLAIALALISPLLPRAVVRDRAERSQNRFTEQLPQVLDGLASGLSAGLSFKGAVDFVLSELPEPAYSTFARLSRRLELGIPIPESLLRLQQDVAEEGLSLVIDGLILQRQFGGDMVQMLSETAALLRDRLELEREVRAITTQGRLSGIIIAALVPVSAGLLLAFNPRYIDVLFDNVIGQALVIFALILQLIGWAIISRLVRIRY